MAGGSDFSQRATASPVFAANGRYLITCVYGVSGHVKMYVNAAEAASYTYESGSIGASTVAAPRST